MADEVEILAGDRSGGRLRSGTAARLAGLPVTTLRVWERRYGVVAAPKTATGQRLYSADDVQRLRLIKCLTLRGHAIGSIATLAFSELQRLADGLPAGSASPRIGHVDRRIVVVGRAAARRLEPADGIGALEVHEDLEQAADRSGDADVLLIHLATLQPPAVDRLLAVAALRRARSTVVTYAFASEAAVESLHRAGVTTLREPVVRRDLLRVLTRDTAAPARRNGEGVAPARAFTDEALVAFAQTQTAIACECLRHVSEIVLQVAAFETYSAECVSRHPEDAVQHARLNQLAGTTRARFEQALMDLAAHEGVGIGDESRP